MQTCCLPLFLKANQLLLLFSAMLLLTGCLKTEKTMEEMKPYDGPVMEVENMETVFTDSAETKIRLKAAKQVELQNGNREFPKGVLVEFYEHGKIKSTLTSNFGRYYKESDQYMVSGNVIIKSLEEEKRMNTEEMFWIPKEERVFVAENKQVVITTKTDVLYGKGLKAKQDFSDYEILNPHGEKAVEK